MNDSLGDSRLGYLILNHETAVGKADLICEQTLEGVAMQGSALDFVLEYVKKYSVELLAAFFARPEEWISITGVKGTQQHVTWFENATTLLDVLFKIDANVAVPRRDLRMARHIIDAIWEEPLLFPVRP